MKKAATWFQQAFSLFLMIAPIVVGQNHLSYLPSERLAAVYGLT
jgi:hypothetical protein